MPGKHQNIIRIAVTGPESTGKSTLSKQLARHYNTVWVPEFARSYINNLDREYEEADLLAIAKGQVENERKLTKEANRFIFFDTELLVIKIWAEHKYGAVDPWILAKYHEVTYDYYLLADTDLTWESDPQRENPDKGNFFFNWFRKELNEKKAVYGVVSGREDERLHNAISIIEKRGQNHLIKY